MKQVCLVNGQVSIVDVPAPMCDPGGVLVRTSHSLISTGTELAATAGGGSESLVRKAIANPQLVRRVMEKVSTTGLRDTIALVRARMTATLPLGYSSAGEVIAVGECVRDLKAGDRVACAGAGVANHAEINFVPRNLAALIPDGVTYEQAAFATVAAIALQGVRRLNCAIGERVVVVGLGLIGLLTVQLLRLSGARVLGVEPLKERLDLALALGMEVAVQQGGDCEPEREVSGWTGGAGADGVVICASAGDFSLLNRSLEFCRKKGRLVLVGDVPIRIARDRLYKKEIDFLISCSYGPGRYDPSYELEGHDYPLPYVRWTEGRNIDEVLRLISRGSLSVSGLAVRSFPVDSAADAYSFLRSGSRPIAALIEYGLPPRVEPIQSRRVRIGVASGTASGRIALGVIGAGSHFRGVLLPNLLKQGGFSIKWVSARSGPQLRDLASRHGIPYVTTDAEEILSDPEVKAVLIATRHDLHVPLVIAAARAGKHIFVEKPLGLTVADCERAVSAAEEAGVLLAVGFNRRFSPLARTAKTLLDRFGEPKTILYRVNAGRLLADHWLLDVAVGGGRLRGEGVHFFDFIRYLVGADPMQVRAAALSRGTAGIDPTNVSVNISFADGSLGVVLYTSQGDKGMGKERVEAFGGDRSLVIDDFSSLHVWGVRDARDMRVRGVAKGHLEILQNFHDAISGKATLEATGNDGYWATWCAEEAERSIRI